MPRRPGGGCGPRERDGASTWRTDEARGCPGRLRGLVFPSAPCRAAGIEEETVTLGVDHASAGSTRIHGVALMTIETAAGRSCRARRARMARR
jgi:hypothetical protein